MAPILLKVKGNSKFLPFGNLGSTEDLSKTWRVCTKVKDSLENGSRLENLSWRLWFAHNVNQKKKDPSTGPSFEVPERFDFNQKKQTVNEKEIEYKRNLKIQQQTQAQHLLQEQFTLQKFTSDQAGDQVIELDDIFKDYYLNPNLTSNPASSLHWPDENYPLPYSDPNDFYSQGSALYVSAETMPPIPIGTLHNRLLSILPKETLESAEKLILSSVESNLQVPVQSAGSFVQSTPSTPFLSFSSSTSSALSFQQPVQTPLDLTHHPLPNQPYPSSQLIVSHPALEPRAYTTQFNLHSHDSAAHQSKSLPPSRVSSPELQPLPKKPAVIRRGPISGSPAEGKTPICSNCSTTTTPLWRRSVDDELLCNACGLYLKLHNIPRPKHLKPQSSRKDAKDEESVIQPVCSNCGTSTTPLWRRDIDGSPLCNACGLYLKLHHQKRPLSMKTDNIKKRQRTEHSGEPKKKSDLKETTYQFMEGMVITKDDSNYQPFNSFGINQFNCQA
ncbi:hypothetical protein BY458DRAFT_526962 [Sporodiniella umbellata]|nr:hypothetical protein BY458DRAFT_526962 [Sporodiniella umbellata]